MPESPRIWVPTETLAPGVRLLLYGSAAGGAVDYAAPEAGAAGYARTPGEDVGRAGGDAHTGRLESGPFARETPAVALHATPRVFGTFRFGVKTIERDTGETLASGHGEVEVFISSAPEPPTALGCVEALEAGAVKFEIFGQRCNG